MERRLFCEMGPLAYRISMEKEILRRRLSDALGGETFASLRSTAPLPVLIYRHSSLIRRRLGGTDMTLQENKAVNLSLAAPCIDGILIRPGETFSLWRLVGRTSAARGFLEGLTVRRGAPGQGVGGGLCQLSNLIHWMVLHSELTITEHHHHDGVDLFPDFKRQIPFGTGTSISYNYIDYRVRNDTDNTYQLLVRTDPEYLRGELRAERPLAHSFHVYAKDEYFSREPDGVYRNGTVVRNTIDRVSGRVVASAVIRRNHARIAYDESLVSSPIREEEPGR